MGKRHITLRTKFLMLFAGIALVPLVAVVVLTVLQLQGELRKGAIELDREIANAAAEEIKAFVATEFGIIESIGIAYPSLNDDGKDALLEQILFNNKSFRSISVVDARGMELDRVDTIAAVRDEDLANRADTREYRAVVLEGIYVGEVSRESGNPIFPIGVARADPEGVFLGAVFAHIDARFMERVVERVADNGDRGRAFIVNRRGLVIAHPDISFALAGRDFSGLPSVRAVIEGSTSEVEALSAYVNDEGDEVIGAGVSIRLVIDTRLGEKEVDTGWIIVVEQKADIVLSFVRQASAVGVIIIITAFAAAAAFTVVFTNRIVHPIEELNRASLRFGEGHLDERVYIRTKDEIEDLANGFNKMAENLHSSIREVVGERNKLKVVLAGITDAVIAVDLEGSVITFNEMAESIVGWKEEAALGKPVSRLFKLYEENKDGRRIEVTPSKYCPQDNEKYEGTRLPFRKNNLVLVGARDSEKYVNVSSGRIGHGKDMNVGWIISIHDVSREMHVEKLKSEFVTVAAHQLRTPLTGLKWALGSLMNKEKTHKHLPKDETEVLKVSYDRTASIIDLVNNLLDVAYLEEGKFLQARKKVNVATAAEEVVHSRSELANGKNLSMRFKVERGGTFDVMIDPKALRLVLENLIDNAIWYTKEGEVKIEVEDNEDGVSVSVSDTGIGIPNEHKKRLFGKFFRGEKAVAMHTDGSGLGLFIVKNIIDVVGGVILFESEEGKGTKFVVLFHKDLPSGSAASAQLSTARS